MPDARELFSAIKDHLNVIIILFAAFIAAAIFVWQAIATRSYVSPAEQSAILHTLFVSDTLFLVISTALALLIIYISSLSGRGMKGIQYDAFAVFIIVMIVPLAFIGCMLAYKPPGLYNYCISISSLLSGLSLLASICLILYAISSVQPLARVRYLVDQINSDFHQSGLEQSTKSIALQQPLVSSATLALLNLLKMHSETGDTATVKAGINTMAALVMKATGSPDLKDMAMARSMICNIVETGALGAETQNPGVVYHTIDRLKEISIKSRRVELSSMAFRGIGYVYSACLKFRSGIRVSLLDSWLAQVYLQIYDSSSRPESLNHAVKAAERVVACKDDLAPEERSNLFFVAGQVYCRQAKVEKSSDKAMLSISMLEQALNSGESGLLDKALINAEVGSAYVILAAFRNPVKSYKKALSSFEEAGKTLTVSVSPWDAARLEADIGNASVLLADEFYRIHRYDDALASARSAIEHYSFASSFFTPARSKEVHGRIMSDAGLAHTVISEIFLRSHELNDALKHVSMALSCYTTAVRMIDREYAPDAFASMKVTMGMAQASMAEICFKEKRYEEAITACDSAIQSYNEALKLYDGAGKDRLATETRKHLKQASDLFNTFLMIGKGKIKPDTGEIS